MFSSLFVAMRLGCFIVVHITRIQVRISNLRFTSVSADCFHLNDRNKILMKFHILHYFICFFHDCQSNCLGIFGILRVKRRKAFAKLYHFDKIMNSNTPCLSSPREKEVYRLHLI